MLSIRIKIILSHKLISYNKNIIISVNLSHYLMARNLFILLINLINKKLILLKELVNFKIKNK
jgi:hypothetical protein